MTGLRRSAGGALSPRSWPAEEASARRSRQGVALTEGVDYLNQMGEAWADLGYVLQLSGRRDEAGDALRRALALFEAKGNVVTAGHTREALSELG